MLIMIMQTLGMPVKCWKYLWELLCAAQRSKSNTCIRGQQWLGLCCHTARVSSLDLLTNTHRTHVAPVVFFHLINCCIAVVSWGACPCFAEIASEKCLYWGRRPPLYMLVDVWLYGCKSIGSVKGQLGMSKDTRTFVTLVTNTDPLTGLQACHGARNAG